MEKSCWACISGKERQYSINFEHNVSQYEEPSILHSAGYSQIDISRLSFKLRITVIMVLNKIKVAGCKVGGEVVIQQIGSGILV